MRILTVFFLLLSLGLFTFPQANSLSLSKQDRLVGKLWKFEQIEKDPIQAPKETKLLFHKEGRVTGSTGCNHFSGAFKLTGESSLQFGGFATTRMACFPKLQKQEDRLLKTLEKVQSYFWDQEGWLYLKDAKGEVLLKLSPFQ